MNIKSSLLILASAALLASCGQASSSQTGLSTGSITSEPSTSVTSDAGSKTSEESQQGQTSKEGEVSTVVTSEGGESSAEDTHQGQTTEDSHQGQSSQTTTGEESSYDVSGIVEEASAPEGVVLTDWTDEMKVILRKYLHGYLPPFYFVESLKVTYDELGYLSVTGKGDANTLTNYGATLYLAGWDGYIEGDEAGRDHLYGRIIYDDGILEVDALVASNIFSANFEFTPSTSDWPEGYIALAMEEYGSVAEVPVLPASSYIAQISYMYEVDIFCVGVEASYLATYAQALENARWTVTSETIQGYAYYTAVSLDALAVLEFYHDGTGIQLILNHGEGEIYDTWASCIAAIDDFATHDLRLSQGISSDIPEVPTALRYTIDRSTRGRLTIQALKNTSFKMGDVIAYRELCREAGLIIDETKATGEEYIVWAYPEDHSYALCFELGTYYTDLGDAISTFEFTLQDYRIYEGYIVSDSWPEAMVATIVNRVAPGSSVPGYFVENAVYYAKSNYSDEIVVDIVNPGNNAVNVYKEGLEEYGFKVTEDNGTYLAVDRKKTVQATFSMQNDELHVVIRRYVTPIDIDGDEATLEFKDTTITANEKGWWSNVTFGSTPFSVVLDMNTSSAPVGNYGDYIEPLRLYNGQKVTIAPSDNYSMTKIQFVLVDVDLTGSRYTYDKENIKTQNITGATFDSYNTNTDIATFTVDANHQASGVEFVVNGQFVLESVIVTIVAT